MDVAYPKTGQDIIWKPPAGSISAEWYFVSYNKLGQLNTIQAGTPKVSNTVGSTSQLDFSAAKLASLEQNLLRINPATGLFEPYNIEQAIYAVLQLGGGTANGLCNTSGTAVSRTSGDNFDSGMVGKAFYISGIGYTVQSFTNANSITLSSSAGTQTGVEWSFGRSPQFKLFDRTNTQIGFWGDDSFDTGFVGLFAGRDVRLGGTIGSPILEVDSGGAVTIDGATVTLNLNGVTTSINNTAFGASYAGLQALDNSTGDLGVISPIQMRVSRTNGAMVDAYTLTVSGTTYGFLDLVDSLGRATAIDPRTFTQLDASSNQLFQLLSGLVTKYNGATAVGMGVPPIYASVSLTGQTGSIGATNLQVGGAVAPAGLYRYSWYGKTTTASGSDTLTVTIHYHDGVAARTRAFAFLLSSTASNGTQQIIETIEADGANHIQYSTTRSGATGSPVYALKITVERLA